MYDAILSNWLPINVSVFELLYNRSIQIFNLLIKSMVALQNVLIISNQIVGGVSWRVDLLQLRLHQ